MRKECATKRSWQKNRHNRHGELNQPRLFRKKERKKLKCVEHFNFAAVHDKPMEMRLGLPGETGLFLPAAKCLNQLLDRACVGCRATGGRGAIREQGGHGGAIERLGQQHALL